MKENQKTAPAPGQKNRETDLTKFKLVVYYSHKASGVPYSYLDIEGKKNRKYHDSHDFILTADGYKTRHDLALNKLLSHLEKWKSHIYSALIFVNDFVKGEQLLIGKFHRNEEFNEFIQPLFKSYDNNQVFVSDLIAPPLQVYKLQNKILPKKHQAPTSKNDNKLSN